jgi:hypothetical protein
MKGAPEITRAAEAPPGDDVGIVLEVVGQHGADHLDFVLEALHEQRADRTVDQAAGEGSFCEGAPSRRGKLPGILPAA